MLFAFHRAAVGAVVVAVIADLIAGSDAIATGRFGTIAIAAIVVFEVAVVAHLIAEAAAIATDGLAEPTVATPAGLLRAHR